MIFKELVRSFEPDLSVFQSLLLSMKNRTFINRCHG